MSRPSHLPPRCPLQKKGVVRQTPDPCWKNHPGVNKSGARHHRSLSQSSMYEDQPAWLDDLLSDSDSIPKGVRHCRSVSDSFALLDGFVPNVLLSGNEGELVEDVNIQGSGCKYGPNSPRRRCKEFSDNTVLLDMSDYVHPRPLQFLEDIPQSYGTSSFDLNGEFCDAPNYIGVDAKAGKRHPGQRSRARKLQYIAELERTVTMFQTLELELAARVSTLLQQKAVLSMENNKLKQKVTVLQQQNLIMDGEYQNLREEAEMLELGLAKSLSRCKFVGSNDTDSARISWKTLDWTKLHM